jgi:hypothetical protein
MWNPRVSLHANIKGRVHAKTCCDRPTAQTEHWTGAFHRQNQIEKLCSLADQSLPYRAAGDRNSAHPCGVAGVGTPTPKRFSGMRQVRL